MTKDEALRMALDALKNAYWPINPDLLPAHNTKECGEAITAIKEALAQPKKEQGEPVNDPAEYDDYDAAVRRNEGKA